MKVYFYLQLKWNQFKDKFFGEESGAVDLIVIIILIAVAVALALVFKDKLVELMNKLFASISSGAEEVAKKPN